MRKLQTRRARPVEIKRHDEIEGKGDKQKREKEIEREDEQRDTEEEQGDT